MKKRASYQLILLYGFIVAGIPIVYNAILLVSGQLLEYRGSALGRPLVVFAYLLFVPILISVAIYTYKKKNNGFLTLKEALILGAKISLLTVLLLVGYDLVFNTLLAPSFYEDYYGLHESRMLEEFMEPRVRNNQENPLGEFEHIKNYRINKNWASLYVFDRSWGAIMWLLTSLIAGLLMKKSSKK